jgi:hypothetical protein
MAKHARRHADGHEILEVLTPDRRYEPYDHLILRHPGGQTTWTVLDCERQGDPWQVTATRCLESCRKHRRRR